VRQVVFSLEAEDYRNHLGQQVGVIVVLLVVRDQVLTD
jgi:hypothetical protein